MQLYGRTFTETEILIGAIVMGILTLIFLWGAIAAFFKGNVKQSIATGFLVGLSGTGFIQYASYWW
jgi:hypothetical protein